MIENIHLKGVSEKELSRISPCSKILQLKQHWLTDVHPLHYLTTNQNQEDDIFFRLDSIPVGGKNKYIELFERLSPTLGQIEEESTRNHLVFI